MPPTSKAPTKRLCWQRPALDGPVNPMLPPCDRAAGHGGKHSWELDAEVRMMAAELKKQSLLPGALRVDGTLAEIARRLYALVGVTE